MNVMNRLIVILEILATIVLVPILIVLFLFFHSGTGTTISNLGRTLSEGGGAFLVQLICVSVALLVFIIAILMLFLELRSNDRRLHIHSADGSVAITQDAIVQRLEHSIMQIADIASAKPHVATAKNKQVNVTVAIETSPEANVTQKTQEVIAAVKQVMEQQMGLTVGKVLVQVDYSRKQTKSQGA